MKLNSNLLSLTALSALAATLVGAADIGTCDDQAKCISFSIQKTNNCFGEDCGIQVCMVLDTDKSGCPKVGEYISHLCAASDGGGCAAYNIEDGDVTPLTGKGGSNDCTSTTFDGKCEPEEYGGQKRVEMCQEGKPGEKVYWALKDADIQETGETDMTGLYTDFTYDIGGSTACSPTIKCKGDGHTLECGSPQNSMYDSTRVWEYTIPPNDNSACDLCGSPGPTPPSPTPDLSPVNPPGPNPPNPTGNT